MAHRLRYGLCIAASLVFLGATECVQAQAEARAAFDLSHTSIAYARSHGQADSRDSGCRQVPAHVLTNLNLTTEQLSLLPSICWRTETQLGSSSSWEGLRKRSGVPPGVQCKEVTWWVCCPCACQIISLAMKSAVMLTQAICRCDDAGICTEVCARGSVQVEPWLKNAITTQACLTFTHFCYHTVATNVHGMCLAG